MSDEAEHLGSEDDYGADALTVGEYRRLDAQIKAEGRESIPAEDLERYDAAKDRNDAVARQMREAIMRQMPDVAETLKRVGDATMRSAPKGPGLKVTEPAEVLPKAPTVPPAMLDDDFVDSLAEAKREEREREQAQTDALELIAGHVAEMKAEQAETTASVNGLRKDGKRAGGWNIAGVLLAGVAALFAALGLFLGR
jgi:hypothetical protein